MLLTEELSARSAELAGRGKALAADDVRYVHLQFPTMAGALRSKLSPLEKVVSSKPIAFNSALLALTHGDGEPIGDVVFESAISGVHNGYPDILSVADPETLVRTGWRDGVAAVLINTFMPDGSPCGLDVRARLADLEMRAASMGYGTKFAFEFEAFMFHGDDQLMREGRYNELLPYGPVPGVYDQLRHPGFEGLGREFLDRMHSIGADVVAFHAEYGRGMFEFAMAPASALAAADNALRARLYLAELCEERGLAVTFMARFTAQGVESSSGLHVHQSLTADGDYAFAASDEGGLSEVARQYVGGLLHTLPEMHVVFRPTINSYRRMNREEWAPEDASWGVESRMSAVRAVTFPAAGAVRVEHRVAGADANPHLIAIAMLGGGLYGIEHRLDPGDPGTGSSEDPRFAALPRTLEASLELFEESELAREIFGRELVEHYAASRRAELAAFDTWMGQNITAFEFRRYFGAH
jgi:glutamine synthetase